MVFVGNNCVNEEIIKAGMAWVFDYYCKDSVCPDWKQLEKQAQETRIGLWSHPDPVPPLGTTGEVPEARHRRKLLSLGNIMATRDPRFFINLPANILIAKTVSLDSKPGRQQ